MSTDSLRDHHERIGRAVTNLISEHAAGLDLVPVTSRATPDELKKLFAEPLPQVGKSAEEILDQFARDVAPHAMQVPSPRYFGQFNPTPLAIGVWADALCSSLNQNAGAWRNGPTSAMIESQAIRWLCELIGYGDEAFGVLASGGSEANLIALKCARDRVSPDMCRLGARKSGGELTVYTSEQCHYSVEKSLDILGLGRQSLRKIETDERFHVRMDRLRAAIKSDMDEGRQPFCIVGVAGTTSTGVIDPLPELVQSLVNTVAGFTSMRRTAAGSLFRTSTSRNYEALNWLIRSPLILTSGCSCRSRVALLWSAMGDRFCEIPSTCLRNT